MPLYCLEDAVDIPNRAKNTTKAVDPIIIVAEFIPDVESNIQFCNTDKCLVIKMSLETSQRCSIESLLSVMYTFGTPVDINVVRSPSDTPEILRKTLLCESVRICSPVTLRNVLIPTVVSLPLSEMCT